MNDESGKRVNEGAKLSPEDARALDEIMEGAEAPAFLRFEGVRPEVPADPERVARVKRWLDAIGAAPAVEVPGDLLARTLEAVKADAMRIRPAGQGSEGAEAAGGRLRRRSFGEIAAMAVAASVMLVLLVPGINHARQSAQRTACANNLQTLGGAFSNYAAAFGNALPSLAKPADGVWLPREAGGAVARSADAHSNTANILPMVASGYTKLDRLTCPARAEFDLAYRPGMIEVPDSVRGYSYINMYGRARPTWDGKTVVLADRNPLFSAEKCRDPKMNSFNHGSRGNNVLVADGSVQWASTPDIGPGNDNIWTVGDAKSSYEGREVPVGLNDVFLSP